MEISSMIGYIITALIVTVFTANGIKNIKYLIKTNRELKEMSKELDKMNEELDKMIKEMQNEG